MLERLCCIALFLLLYRTKIRLFFQAHPCKSWICNKHEWEGWASERLTTVWGWTTFFEADTAWQCLTPLLEETRRKNGGKVSLDLEQWTSVPRQPFQSSVENCTWKSSLAESFSRVHESKGSTKPDRFRAFKTETADLKPYLSFQLPVYMDFTIISLSTHSLDCRTPGI